MGTHLTKGKILALEEARFQLQLKGDGLSPNKLFHSLDQSA
jgi:hypothetical protein